MKNFIYTLVILLLPILCFGQGLNECGKNDDPQLTPVESEFLNQYMTESQRRNYDLSGKKVLFSRAPGGGTIGTKSEYFDNIRSWDEDGNKISTFLIELTEDEKRISGGYDVIVTYWVKFISKKTQRKLIAEAGRK